MSVFRLLFAVCFVCSINSLNAQITIDFTASATEGCGSLQVDFCDNSSSTAGSIVAWSWNLGGVTSGNQCQGRIFGSPGNYTICLTVTDSQGNSDSKCETEMIKVHALPEPDFIATPSVGCIPLTVSFTDNSPSNNLTEFIWGLDGSSGVVVTNGGASPDAESVYSIADKYTISLTVTDDNGCTNFISKPNLVEAYEPPDVQVHAVETFKCEPPFSVNFVNDNPEPNVTYIWDFGNGTTHVGNTPPPVLYDTEGNFTVTVTGQNSVTDCEIALVLDDYIQINYTADFSFTPDEGCEDLGVTFTDLSLDLADNVLWEFGDGNTSNDFNPTHIYENPGFYTTTLTRYISGCETTFSSTMEVEVFALPEVAYNNDNALGCTLPHSVNFSGVSVDAVSWFWEFGDGATSTDQNPNHVYTEFGDYAVVLTVTNANGCENSIATNTISLIETEALLTNTQFDGCIPLSVTLGENSNTVLPITSWNWEVVTPSETLTSTDENPNFMIQDTGCFDVTLTVINQLGCSDTEVFQDAICTGDDPLPNFEAIPTVSCVEDSVFFFDLSSNTTDLWFWDFGDGENSSEQNPSHIYTDTGFYDITLLVSYHGCINQVTFDDYIQVTEPISNYTVVQNCVIHNYVEFSNSSIGADSMHWDFGVPGIFTDTSSSTNPTFTYPDTGEYTIVLTTFNFTTGCSHDRSTTIYVHDPEAKFDVSTLQGCAPLTINTINNSVHAVQYEWSCTGGTISDAAAKSPNITFTNPGTYSDIQLIVTDVNGCRDTTQFDETIPVNSITTDFDYNPSGGCLPLTVDFTDQSTNLYATNQQWDWVYGNNIGNSSGQNTSFEFNGEGEFSVALTVTDDWGCVGSMVIDNAVDVTDPVALFTADTLACTQALVSFTNQSQGKDLTYFWEFGDGETSTETNPTHNYQTEGVFTACLTATDLYGCDSTFCLDNHVVIEDPVANLSADTAYASCPPLVVTFENLSSNATSFMWDFGDGSGPSNLETPSHVYTTPGLYDVTLIASSTTACADTFVFPGLIVLDGPLGNFHYEIDTSCIPMAVTFMAESQGQFMYIWDFGDGTPLDTVLNVSTDTTIYTYTTSGTFIPKLAIVDAIGCERILESPTSIFTPELTLGFQASDTVMCDFNNPVTFLNLINSTGPIGNLEWFFEGGTPASSTDFEPTITFADPGKYDVMLVVDNAYCVDTLLLEDHIRIGDVPTANFSMSDNGGCEPFEVTFTDVTNVINGSVAQWHWIFGDGFESFQETPTHTFVDGTSFEVQLLVTTDVGCVDSVTQIVNVTLQPDVELIADPVICMGEIAELQATILSDPTGVNYFWEPSPTLSCTNCLNPQANPLDTTVYTFVAVSPEGCETRTEITVFVRPYTAPVITISEDTTICANDVVQLLVDGGDNIFSYDWDNSRPGLSCYNSCYNPIAIPDASTTYVVTVTNIYDCSSVDSVRVDIIDPFQPFAGTDRTMCEGDSVHLNMNQNLGTNPVWLQANGLDCSTCYDAVATPAITTDFIAQLITPEGCEIIDSVRVNVLTQQDIYAGEDVTICRGESILLDGQFLYPDPNLSTIVSWSPASSLDNPNILTPEAFPSESTTYTLVIESEKCSLSDSVRVEVVDKTEIEAVGGTVCLGDTIELEVIGFADNFQWSPAATLSDTNIANPEASPEETTTYLLVASLSVCEPDTAMAIVEVNPLPEIYLPETFSFFDGQSVQLLLENTSSNYIYNWQPATGLSCTDCPNPIATSAATTEYSVQIIDADTGCETTLITTLKLLDKCEKSLIGVPNAISPNGDGINDQLEIQYSTQLILDDYVFRVFDRWGTLVFETKNINEPWDGTFSGRTLPNGVYVYMIEFPCQLDGSSVIKEGDITIMR